ncbi:expressed unknown protein [Seminavis robusta]|uniref:MYND-type domain-containing protein n=1 Tax=Seminavis robusta TaxID=568900 RepID=A0A9N8HN20_9STRA|nr:expressed unknown protein [Seminavis robusta]|eukprot:Sro1047_g235170.1 n/a (230) ;mRNA; r:25638-26327
MEFARENADAQAANEAFRKALMKEHRHAAELRTIGQAWQRENPGQQVMQFGGPETQRLYDQFVAPPPQRADDNKPRADKYTCAFCGKASDKKMACCSICKLTSYCSRNCQKTAWKAHKLVCKPTDKEPKGMKTLTWAQVEAHQGRPVDGKTLEVRVMQDESMMRQVFQCKDRTGQIERVTAYTNSRRIPGMKPGVILRWKNPRFHCFMDGSRGARIEEEDLANVTVVTE